MTNRLVLLGLAFTVAACAMLGGEKSPPCKDPVCHVSITVTGSCTVAVSPYTLEVAAGNRNMMIQWKVDGAEFAPGGIFLKTPSGGELSDPEAVNSNFVLVKNKHGKPGRYEYGIRLMQGGKHCPVVDPWIVNG